jgi:mannitol-specific phosphotransferase system IIBC component
MGALVGWIVVFPTHPSTLYFAAPEDGCYWFAGKYIPQQHVSPRAVLFVFLPAPHPGMGALVGWIFLVKTILNPLHGGILKPCTNRSS